MLSLATTALAQGSGNESGTDQIETKDADKINWLERNETAIGAVVGIFSIIGYLSGLFSRIKKIIFTILGKTPPEGTGRTQQISTESKTTTVSGKRGVAIGGDLSGSIIITGDGNVAPEALELLRPKPADPPGKINNIPHPHNPNFTGRVDLLEKLHDALASGERAAFTQTQAITGLGGVGKTQLALEYSYRHADAYQIVWWVRSEEPATLAADYAGLARRLDLPEKSSQDQRVTVEAVRCWLEQNAGWLLVFDNAQNFKDLEDYLPRAGSGHVIITSRNQSWGGVARMLNVDIFTPAESVEFLRRRTGQDDENAAKALADALGNLPLALEQAGAYIEGTGISLSAYLKLFKERQKELLSRGKPDAYPDIMATTWDISFQKASEEAPSSADLLNLCAFLAPDDIPKSLLTDGVEHLPEPLASTVTDEMALNDAVAALKRYSLMNVAGKSLSVHRLVQAVAQDRLSDEEKKQWAEAAVRLVNDAFPFKSQDIRTWDVCSVLLPHALTASGYAEEFGAAQKETVRLLNHAGNYLFGRAKFKDAESQFERALSIAENVYGQDRKEVATTVNNLGMVLQKMGNLNGAKNSYERALAISEKTLDSDDSKVAGYLNNLGSVLREIGDLQGAKERFERALEINEKESGLHHPYVAIDVNNIGGVLKEMGDLEGAEEHYERALEIDMKAYGPDHPEVAIRMNNLAGVLKALGDPTSAEEHYERALEIFREYLGEDHPKTKTVRENLESLRR